MYVYPAKDVLFYSADVHGNAIVRQRIEILKRIVEEEASTIIFPVEALMERVPGPEHLKKNRHLIRVGDTVDVQAFSQIMTAFGYEKRDAV